MADVFVKKTAEGTLLFRVSENNNLLRLTGRLHELPNYILTPRTFAEIHSFLAPQSSDDEVGAALSNLKTRGYVREVE